jgi:hypothetical protein
MELKFRIFEWMSDFVYINGRLFGGSGTVIYRTGPKEEVDMDWHKKMICPVCSATTSAVSEVVAHCNRCSIDYTTLLNDYPKIMRRGVNFFYRKRGNRFTVFAEDSSNIIDRFAEITNMNEFMENIKLAEGEMLFL